jgi:biotin carboxyl carrier protein
MRKYSLKINDKKYDLEVQSISTEDAKIKVNGKTYKVDIEDIITGTPKSRALPSTPPNTPPAKKPVEKMSNPSSEGEGKGIVTAPIPGSILAIHVKEGDSVTAGQPLFKMEAMKMENEITSQKEGTVSSILVNVGDAVNQGAKLIIIS